VSRKPVDKQQPTECRQAIWEWIRAWHGSFTVNDILMIVRLEPSSVNDYLTGLVNAPEQYLTARKSPSRGVLTQYVLNNDIGNDAPRVRKDGTPVTMGQGRQQMWNAMRILKNFSVIDLAFNSSISECQIAESEAKGYCAALCKAGYLVGRGSLSGVEGQRYMLIPSMWTGPHPPQIQRTKQVYDPNLKRVVWSRIEGGAE
jgi:hypothetical protein